MVSDMLHSKIDISEMDQDTLHIKLRHTKYQIPHVTHKFAHNINEIKGEGNFQTDFSGLNTGPPLLPKYIGEKAHNAPK